MNTIPWPPKFIALLLGITLSSLIFLQIFASSIATSSDSLNLHMITIVPDQMVFTGDVATKANSVGQCTESWLSNTPEGSIIIGVNPTSCNPQDWMGGSASTEVHLEDIYEPTVWTLKLFWPDRDGKGLHSPEKNRLGSITLDDKPLWSKRTTESSTFNDYYAAEHKPILTTIVVTQSITHTISFSVSPHTAWDFSEIELTAHPYPTTIKGIGYSPFRDCQLPNTALVSAI